MAFNSETSSDQELRKRVHSAYGDVKERIHDRIVGMDEVIELLVIGIFCGGHCLLVGVPGLAKTLLISTLSELLDLKFSRIQFTPDLMPSDIVGTEVIAENTGTGEREFRFMSGPVFANVVLADEINRTPPKTQAALMEAMEEHQVTIGGRTHPLEPPFFVLATQNPIEQEGTYPLPAAQLDRFTFMINVDYPSRSEEYRIIRTTTAPRTHREGKLLEHDEILRLMKLVENEKAPHDVVAYATSIARATRPNEDGATEMCKRFLSWGVGPRGAQALVHGAKVRAIIHGRPQATLDDVRALAAPAFQHRMILNFQAQAEGQCASELLEEILEHGGITGAHRRPTTVTRVGGGHASP